MTVSSPRAYAAYALEPAAAVSGLRPAPDSRPLRARVPVRLRLHVRRRQPAHHVVAALIEALQAPLLPLGERVRGDDREGHGVVEIADHGPRQLVGVNLPPAHCLGRRGTREPAGVGARVGDLKVIVVDRKSTRLNSSHRTISYAV